MLPRRFLFILLLAQVFGQSAVSQSADLDTVRARVVAELMEPSAEEGRAQTLVRSLRKDGSWADINYQDVSRTGFEHHQHLDNVLTLSRAYQQPSTATFHNPALGQAIDAALDFWFDQDFISDNWWWNQIGVPDRLVSILLILDEQLTETQKKRAAPIAGRAHLGATGARPGGDLIKIAGIRGKYGLFLRNAALVDTVIRTMANEIQFATERATPDDVRGLQPDFSFQHRNDRITYTLSYGLGYARAFADWAAKVAGTQYHFPDRATRLLVDFYLDGICQTMTYGKYPDPGAKNRDITRQGALHPADIDLPKKLLRATDYRQDELKKIIRIRQEMATPNLMSNKAFWRVDYISHQRPDYFTSVRMYSTRNHSMEVPHNGEGVKNHHLGDGANFISRTGMEYTDIFPVWDWQKVPGTTVVQKPALPPEDQIQKKGLTAFVGGVSDGRYGAAAFDFASPLDPLVARKAWFFSDQEYVCLGAGIQSEAPHPVVTTLNQCLLKQPTVVRQADRTDTLVPNVGANDVDAYLRNSPPEILVNSSKVQAVQHHRLGISQVVFYAAGELRLSDELALSSEQPALVMVQTNGSRVKKITVADPSQTLFTIGLKITSRLDQQGAGFRIGWDEKQRRSDIVIDLPQQEYAGQSVSIDF